MSESFWKNLNYALGLIGVFVFLGLTFFASHIEIKDMDIWFHLAAGRHVLEHQTVPKVDIFSSTMPGKPWIDHEWLFQILVASVFQRWGAEGLIGITVAMIFLSFLILLFMGYNKDRLLLIVFLLLLVLMVFGNRLTIRPDLFSLVFLLIYFTILAFHLNKRWSVYVLFLIQVLWCNIHGFFILGPLIVFLAIMAEGAKRHLPLPYQWKTIGRLNEEEFGRLKLIGIVVLLASFINPQPIQGFLYPFQMLFQLSGQGVFFQDIVELQKPITWATIFSWGNYLPYRLLIVISFFGFLLNIKKVNFSNLLSWLVFLVFSLSAIRNLVFFSFVAYLVTLENFNQIHLNPQSLFFLLSKRSKYVFSIGLTVILVSFMVTQLERISYNGYYDFERYERKSEFGGVSLRNFPYKAADFLVNNKISGNFLNDFNSGSYLVGRTFPQIKVFIDGRTEFYGKDFYNEYIKAWWDGDPATLERIINQYHITGIFLNSLFGPIPKGILNYFHGLSDWNLVYLDYDGVIFLRRVPEQQRFIAEKTLDLSQWQAPSIDLLRLGFMKAIPFQHLNRAYTLYHLEYYEAALQEAFEAVKIWPSYGEAYKIIGRVFLISKQYGKAFEYFRKAKLYIPDDAEVRYELAHLYFLLGDTAQALFYGQELLSLRPGYGETYLLLADIYTQRGDYPQARRILEKALPWDPDHPDILQRIDKVRLLMNASTAIP